MIVSMRAQLWDRTAGGILANGSQMTNTNIGSSSGSIDLYDDIYYPNAQQVEQVLVVELVGPPGWLWGPCNSKPGMRILQCDGVGTQTMHGAVGFLPFATGVTLPPCTTRTWEWAPRQPVGVVGRQRYVLATPTALFQYCVTNYGNVREGSATLIQFQAGTRFPGLVADPPSVSIVKFIDNGRTAYRVSFPLTFRFNQEVQIEAGIGPGDAGITFKGTDTCALSVGFTLGNGNPQDTDTTINPCTDWRPKVL